jgi:hypothetical protein
VGCDDHDTVLDGKDDMGSRDPRHPATLAQAEKMLQRIDKMYALGVKAPEPRSNLDEASRRERVSPRVLRQARQFAATYDAAELKQLRSLRRPNGLPLHYNHFVYLMTVDEREERTEWARRAAENDWTAPVLHAHLKAGRSPLSGGGRPIKIPRDTRLAVQQLVREADLWERRASDTLAQIRERGSRQRKACEELLVLVERVAKSCGLLRKELMQHLAETS